ncbi:MAG: hypothetical protein R3F37_16570 [Candidatus Competibacteraceae bacterium]
MQIMIYVLAVTRVAIRSVLAGFRVSECIGHSLFVHQIGVQNKEKCHATPKPNPFGAAISPNQAVSEYLMSYDQWLYKAAPNTGPMNEWEKDHSVPIGTANEMKALFSEALSCPLKWEEDDKSLYASGIGTPHDFDIMINKDDHIVVLRGCSKKQAIGLAEKLGISAFDPQYSEQLVL